MNETIVAKGLSKHLAEKYADWGTCTRTRFSGASRNCFGG